MDLVDSIGVVEELQREVTEQARLLGMSGEREADLRGKLERAKREVARLREDNSKLQKDLFALEGAARDAWLGWVRDSNNFGTLMANLRALTSPVGAAKN